MQAPSSPSKMFGRCLSEYSSGSGRKPYFDSMRVRSVSPAPNGQLDVKASKSSRSAQPWNARNTMQILQLILRMGPEQIQALKVLLVVVAQFRFFLYWIYF